MLGRILYKRVFPVTKPVNAFFATETPRIIYPGVRFGSVLVKSFLLQSCKENFGVCKDVFRGGQSIRHMTQQIAQPPKKPGYGRGKGPVTWKTLGITCVMGGAMLAGMFYLKRKKDLEIDRERKRTLGKAAIGGRFELLDKNKKLCASEDYHGQWLLLYFGFTHCPDVCPDEMDKMVEVVELVEKNPEVPNLQPLFISVDPDRDTPELVGKYVEEFSPKIIGLTGSKAQVDKACKAFRVYYSSGPEDIDKDYIVDHTIITYLINPDGEFVDYYGQTSTPDLMASSIAMHMYKFNKLKKGLFGL